MCLIGRIANHVAHHGNEDISDAGRANLANAGELLPIDTLEQQNAATEHLTLVNGLKSACGSELLGMDHHFEIARLKFFHAAIEDDATLLDEHEIGEDVLDLFHLMGGDEDGAAAIEVVIQQ